MATVEEVIVKLKKQAQRLFADAQATADKPQREPVRGGGRRGQGRS